MAVQHDRAPSQEKPISDNDDHDVQHPPQRQPWQHHNSTITGCNNHHLDDISADLFLAADQYSKEELQSQSDRVRWKLDLIVLPIVALTHSLQFMNKTALNYASAYKLIEDLGLEGGRYGWAAAIFNFGFVAWSFPTNLILQKVPIGKYTGSVILIWALLQMCTAATHNYAGILAIRFLLGMFEAAIAPSAMNIVALWYTRDEAPLRMCIVLGCNGFAAMVSALLAYGVGHVQHAGLDPWRLYFLIVGAMNFLWGIVFLIFIPDTPRNAWFLTQTEKVCATWRVAQNLVGLKTTHYKTEQIWEAVSDVKVWCTTILAAVVGIIIGGVTNFMTALIKGFGFSGLESTILQLPLGAIAFVVVPLAGLTATLVPNTRCLVTILICIPPLGGLIGIRLISLDHRYDLLGCAWLQLLVLGLICLTWIIMTANIGGHTKRTVANGLWFVFFGAGNIGGAHIFLPDQKPRYITAITILYICYAIVIVTTAILWIHLYRQNRARDRIRAEAGISVDQSERDAIVAGFRDVTDKQSLGFRYVY